MQHPTGQARCRHHHPVSQSFLHKSRCQAVFLVGNIAGSLIAFLAFVAFLNGVLSWWERLFAFDSNLQQTLWCCWEFPRIILLQKGAEDLLERLTSPLSGSLGGSSTPWPLSWASLVAKQGFKNHPILELASFLFQQPRPAGSLCSCWCGGGRVWRGSACCRPCRTQDHRQWVRCIWSAQDLSGDYKIPSSPPRKKSVNNLFPGSFIFESSGNHHFCTLWILEPR